MRPSVRAIFSAGVIASTRVHVHLGAFGIVDTRHSAVPIYTHCRANVASCVCAAFTYNVYIHLSCARATGYIDRSFSPYTHTHTHTLTLTILTVYCTIIRGHACVCECYTCLPPPPRSNTDGRGRVIYYSFFLSCSFTCHTSTNSHIRFYTYFLCSDRVKGGKAYHWQTMMKGPAVVSSSFLSILHMRILCSLSLSHSLYLYVGHLAVYVYGHDRHLISFSYKKLLLLVVVPKSARASVPWYVCVAQTN